MKYKTTAKKMILELTADESQTLKGFIEYGLDSGNFDYLSPEEEIEKSRIINILNILKAPRYQLVYHWLVAELFF